MRRGTTPTINFSVTDEEEQILDLHNWTIYLTIKDQHNHTVEYTNDSLELQEDGSIEVTMRQEDTILLKGDEVALQVRAVDPLGKAIASDIITMELKQILKGGVICNS